MKQSLTTILIISFFTLQTFSQTEKNQTLDYHSEHIEKIKI